MKISLSFINRNRSHHYIFQTIRNPKQRKFAIRENIIQTTGRPLEGYPIGTDTIKVNEPVVVFLFTENFLLRYLYIKKKRGNLYL